MRFGFVPTLLAGAILGPGSNAAFTWVAYSGGDHGVFAAAMFIDGFSTGFAGTALVAYMSSLTSVGYTATQYALLSSFYALLGKVLKGFSGVAVEALQVGHGAAVAPGRGLVQRGAGNVDHAEDEQHSGERNDEPRHRVFAFLGFGVLAWLLAADFRLAHGLAPEAAGAGGACPGRIDPGILCGNVARQGDGSGRVTCFGRLCGPPPRGNDITARAQLRNRRVTAGPGGARRTVRKENPR